MLRPPSVALALVVALAVGLAGATGPAAAAGDTEVRLSVGADRIAVGETTTVEVVVGASGGVGAYNLTISASDDAATVREVDLVGDPRLSQTTVAGDGDGARLVAAVLDTADEGRVTVARVTVAGEAAGEADLDVAVDALADESGENYRVTATRGATLSVAAGASAPGPSGDADWDEYVERQTTPTPTPEPTAASTPAATPTPAPSGATPAPETPAPETPADATAAPAGTTTSGTAGGGVPVVAVGAAALLVALAAAGRALRRR